VDRVVNPDQTVVVTYPKGAQPDHALTIQLKASHNGDKIVIALHATNNSGQKISLLTGMFGSAEVVDDQGNTLNFEEFDNDWTLKGGDNDGYIKPDSPLAGNIVVDAPASGSTLNMWWDQAIGYDGLILIRDIPITG